MKPQGRNQDCTWKLNFFLVNYNGSEKNAPVAKVCRANCGTQLPSVHSAVTSE